MASPTKTEGQQQRLRTASSLASSLAGRVRNALAANSGKAGRKRGFFHVLLMLMFIFGIVFWGVFESQTLTLARQSLAPLETGAALGGAREGLLNFAARRENPGQRDVADTHPAYSYYNIYSSVDLASAGGNINSVSSGSALENALESGDNDRFIVWRPGQLPCPDVWGVDVTGATTENLAYELWSHDRDFDGVADYDDTFCSLDSAGISLSNGVPDGGRAGRYPWREYYDYLVYSRGAGVGDLRDAYGNRLWYVVSQAAVDVRRPLNPYRLLREQDGWLSLEIDSPNAVSSTQLVDQTVVEKVAAIVISPGRNDVSNFESAWFDNGVDGSINDFQTASGASASAALYLEGALTTATPTLPLKTTVDVSVETADVYSYLTANNLLSAFDDVDAAPSMDRIVQALSDFEERVGFLPRPTTFESANTEFINRRLGRVSQGTHDFLHNTSGVDHGDGNLQGVAVLHDTDPIFANASEYRAEDITPFGYEGDRIVIDPDDLPCVKLSPYSRSLGTFSTAAPVTYVELFPPYGDLQLSSTSVGTGSVAASRNALVLPAWTPMIAGSDFLARSDSEDRVYAVQPSPAPDPEELVYDSGRIHGSPLANAVYADLAPSSITELGRSGYAVKMTEGSFLMSDQPVTINAECPGYARAAEHPLQQFRPTTDGRVYTGVAKHSTSTAATLHPLPPDRTPLVPGNQGLLPVSLLPGQIPPDLLEPAESAQLMSNERGFMSSYVHEYTNALQSKGSTASQLEVKGRFGAYGYFPGRVTMSAYDPRIVDINNVLINTSVTLTPDSLDDFQPRVTPTPLNAKDIPDELIVRGLIEMPARTKFYYPPGYRFALGSANFVHTSGIPWRSNPGTNKNNSVLRSIREFDYRNYENGAIIHLAPGAVLHDVLAPANSILPDGTETATDLEIPLLTLAYGSEMRFTQLLHYTPGFGTSIQPRTPRQAGFRVEILLKDPTDGPVAANTIDERIANDAEWHLLYPYHGRLVVKSQRIHPYFEYNNSGELVEASASTVSSEVLNVLSRADLHYYSTQSAADSTHQGIYRTNREIVFEPAGNRFKLKESFSAGPPRYGAVDFRGVGASIAYRTTNRSLASADTVENQEDLTVRLDQGLRLGLNPVNLSIEYASNRAHDNVTHITRPGADYEYFWNNWGSKPFWQGEDRVNDGIRDTQAPQGRDVSASTQLSWGDQPTESHEFPHVMLQARLLGDDNAKTPFVGLSPAAALNLDHENLADSIYEHAIHFSERTAIDVGNDDADDELPLFFGFSDNSLQKTYVTVDWLDIDFFLDDEDDDCDAQINRWGLKAVKDSISQVTLPPDADLCKHMATAPSQRRRVGDDNFPPYSYNTVHHTGEEFFGSPYFAMVELASDGLLRTNFGNFERTQVLPAGSRIIFDNETVGEVDSINELHTTLYATRPFENVVQLKTRTFWKALQGTHFITALQTRRDDNNDRVLEKPLPVASVAHGVGFYPLPEQADIVLHGPAVGRFMGLPDDNYVTLVIDTEPFRPNIRESTYPDVVVTIRGINQNGRRYDDTGEEEHDNLLTWALTLGGGAQTLYGTNPRILLNPGDKIPKPTFVGFAQRRWVPRNGYVMMHYLYSGNGIMTVSGQGAFRDGRNEITSNADRRRSLARQYVLYNDFNRVLQLGKGTQVVFDELFVEHPAWYRYRLTKGSSYFLGVNQNDGCKGSVRDLDVCNPKWYPRYAGIGIPPTFTSYDPRELTQGNRRKIGTNVSFRAPAKFGLKLPIVHIQSLSTDHTRYVDKNNILPAAMPWLHVVAHDGGDVIIDLDDGPIVTDTIRPGQIIRSFPGRRSAAEKRRFGRLDVNLSGLETDFEFGDFEAQDQVFIQNNPLFYAIADECRDFVATASSASPTGCASGEGQGLNVDILPGEAVRLPEDTVAPAYTMVIGTRDGAGVQQKIDVEYTDSGTNAVVAASYGGIQLMENGGIRVLTVTNVANVNPGINPPNVTIQLDTTQPSIKNGEPVIVSGSKQMILRSSEILAATDYGLETLIDAGAVSYRDDITLVAGGYTPSYEDSSGHFIEVDPNDILNLTAGSTLASGGAQGLPTRPAPGSTATTTRGTFDLTGYRSVRSFHGELDAESDTPIFVPDDAGGVRLPQTALEGTRITIGGGAGGGGTDPYRAVSLLGATDFDLGPPGYAWQGVIYAPNPDEATFAAGSGSNIMVRANLSQDTNSSPKVHNQFMPMGININPSDGSARNDSYGVSSDGSYAAEEISWQCIYCIAEHPIASRFKFAWPATTPGLELRPAPLPPIPAGETHAGLSFNAVDPATPGLITVTLDDSPTSDLFTVTVLITGTRGLNVVEQAGVPGVPAVLDPANPSGPPLVPAVPAIPAVEWTDTEASFVYELFLEGVSPGYQTIIVDATDSTSEVVEGTEVVVILSDPGTAVLATAYAYSTGAESMNKRDFSAPNTSDPASPARAFHSRSPDSAVIGTFMGPADDNLLPHSATFHDISAADASILADSKLHERTVFSFGRFGDSMDDILDRLTLALDTATDARVRLPLPLNLHNEHGADVLFEDPANVATPVLVGYTDYSLPNPVNEWTSNFSQLYIDGPADPLERDNRFVTLTTPLNSATEVALQVPVPLLTIGGRELPGGSVINLKSKTAYVARRFTGAVRVTLGPTGAIVNVVGGGGAGRPQLIEKTQIEHAELTASQIEEIEVNVVPAAFTDPDNFASITPGYLDLLRIPDDETTPEDESVVANHQATITVNSAKVVWGALKGDDSIRTYDMRTSDAIVIDNTQGADGSAADRPALYDLADHNDPIQGNQHDFLPAGHRMIFPSNGVFDVLAPQSEPRRHDYTQLTINAWPLPTGTQLQYDQITDHDYRTAGAATQRSRAPRTFALANHSVPYHLPGEDLGVSSAYVNYSVGTNSPITQVSRPIDPLSVTVSTPEGTVPVTSSAASDVYQNVWVRVLDTVVVDDDGTDVVLPPGSVINPILGTYLASRQDTPGSLIQADALTIAVLTEQQPVTVRAPSRFSIPALIIPAGVTLRTGANRETFTNVKAIVAHSPYPLEEQIECGVRDNDLRLGNDANNFVYQRIEGVNGGTLERTAAVPTDFLGGIDVPPTLELGAGMGHPCVLLDLAENSDLDDEFVISTERLVADQQYGRTRVNDMFRLIGGRLKR